MTGAPADFDRYTRALRGEEVYRDNAHRRSMPNRVAQLAKFTALEAARERDRLVEGPIPDTSGLF